MIEGTDGLGMASDVSQFILGASWWFAFDAQLDRLLTSALATFLVCGCLRWLLRSLTDRCSSKPHQGPRVWPLLGTTLEHLRHYHRLHDWLLGYFQVAHKLTLVAPVVCGRVYYYTADPDNVKHMLRNKFSNYPKSFRERMDELLGDGIFNSDGEVWRAQRKTAASEFSLKSLRDFSADTFREYAVKLASLCVDQRYRNEAADIQDLYLRTTLDSIGKIGFGVDIGSLPERFPLRPNAFATAFDRANEILTLRFIDPFWKVRRALKIGAEAELRRSIATIDKFVYEVIRVRKEEYRKRHAQIQFPPVPLHGISYGKSDIISRFLDLSEASDQGPMSDKFLRDVVLNFIIAGRDTTAVTMTWMTYMLQRHPDVSNRLWGELVKFERVHDPDCPKLDWAALVREARDRGAEQSPFQKLLKERIKRFSATITYESLKQLVYLQAVIMETLRLYPAVPLDPKQILEDDVLPDGTRLKAGQTIAYSPWCMARLPSIWGSDAQDFNPDRWIQDGAIVQESDFKFATFQAGYRTCLGRDSAFLQLKMTLAILCRFFKFRRADSSSEEKTYRMMATLGMTGGLLTHVRLRKE